VTPWVQARVNQFKNGCWNDNLLDELVQQLRNAYDDPESQERALRSLQSVRQGGRRFVTYLAKFEKLLLEAGGLDWDDSIKKAMLANGLALDIQRALAATVLPPEYTKYVALIHTVAHNLEAIGTREEEASRTTTRSKDQDMDWEPSHTVQIAAQETRQKAKWVTKEEIAERRTIGACLRCGRKGHRIRECGLGPATRPTQVLTAKAAETTPRIREASYESSEEELESGKE
jgi:hypothetical protein